MIMACYRNGRSIGTNIHTKTKNYPNVKKPLNSLRNNSQDLGDPLTTEKKKKNKIT